CGWADPWCRRQRGAWSKNLLESGPEHFVRSPFSARRILMCADDRSVDDRACVVDLVLQLTEDRGPVSLPRPVREAVVDRLPRAKSLRQVTPRRAGLGSIEHGLDEESVSAHRR